MDGTIESLPTVSLLDTPSPFADDPINTPAAPRPYTGAKRGRKAGTTIKDEKEKRGQTGINATPSDIAYLKTFNPSDNATNSDRFADMVEEFRKIRPGGRFSGPVAVPGARLRPGTKTYLKAQIRELEKQVQRLGAVPVTKAEVPNDKP